MPEHIYPMHHGTTQMKFTDITCPYSPPSSHPHIAILRLDPSDVSKFERAFEDEPAVKILGFDRTTPTQWTIFAGCASRTTWDLLESGW
jgi:hypothetical protein